MRCLSATRASRFTQSADAGGMHCGQLNKPEVYQGLYFSQPASAGSGQDHSISPPRQSPAFLTVLASEVYYVHPEDKDTDIIDKVYWLNCMRWARLRSAFVCKGYLATRCRGYHAKQLYRGLLTCYICFLRSAHCQVGSCLRMLVLPTRLFATKLYRACKFGHPCAS